MQFSPQRGKYVSEKLAGKPFLFGSEPSFADFALWHYIDVLRTLGGSVPSDIEQWLDNVAALPGVKRTVVGYCGGQNPNPTYKSVCADPLYSDYAEAIHIDYDPSVLSYADVVDAFDQQMRSESSNCR